MSFVRRYVRNVKLVTLAALLQTGDSSDWIWQYEETERIIRSVSPRPGAPSSAAYMGSGRLCRRSRPGPSFLRAHSAMLYWLRVRADHEAHPRRERRQRAVDRNRRDVAAPPARRRGRDAAEHEVVADGARFRRRPAHPGGRGQAREHRLADAPLLPRRRRVRPAWPAASPLAGDRGAGPRRVDDRPLRERRRLARARAARRSARRPAQGELPRLVRGDDGSRVDEGVQVATRDPVALTGPRTPASASSVRRSSRGSRSRPSPCLRSTTYRTASPRTSASTRTRSRNPAKPNLPNPRLTF